MSGRLCEENMKNLELKRRKRERTTKGYFNKKKIQSQGEGQDTRNKDGETKTPPVPPLLPQTANGNSTESTRRSRG